MLKIFIFAAFIAVEKASGFDPTKHKNWDLLPHKTCGQTNSERIIGGSDASLSAYPWLARIGYSSSKKKNISYYCGGVIANSKTILTAAHCVTDLETNDKVARIRLGEHNLKTDPDCEGSFCVDPVKDFEVSQIVIPKNFNEPLFRNDIAIIRLKEKITFSDSIRPICFPSGDLYEADPVGNIAEVAGWGIYDVDKPAASDILQVVNLPIVKNKVCDKYLPKEATMSSTQLCVGGMVGKDSCGGDSGGPLMKVDDGIDQPRYYVLGVVSFGSKRCGKSRMPGVYTKLVSFMKWFLDNMEETDNNSVNLI